jgi:hypothetical protein
MTYRPDRRATSALRRPRGPRPGAPAHPQARGECRPPGACEQPGWTRSYPAQKPRDHASCPKSARGLRSRLSLSPLLTPCLPLPLPGRRRPDGAVSRCAKSLLASWPAAPLGSALCPAAPMAVWRCVPLRQRRSGVVAHGTSRLGAAARCVRTTRLDTVISTVSSTRSLVFDDKSQVRVQA